MISNGSLIGDAFEQAVELGQQTGQAVAKVPVDLTKAGVQQVKPGQQQSTPGEGGIAQDQAKALKEQQEAVKDLYGAANGSSVTPEQLAQQKQLSKNTDAQKVAQLRGQIQQLHASNYYQPLITPRKQEDPRPAERVEQEKQQDLWEKQQSEAKKDKEDMSLAMATQRTERFRGSGG